MRKTLLLLSLGLLCASLAVAQDSPGGQLANPNDRGSAGANAVHGCLSGTDGNYTLAEEDTGTVLQLVGNDNALRKHLGQEVSITGKMRSDAGTAPPMTSDQTQAPANTTPGTVIKVSHVNMISKHCKSSTITPPSH